jgi:hypothetical protein
LELAIEAYWKVFQSASADRIRIIEAYFRNDPDILIKDPDPFQIYHWWFKSYAYDKPIFPYELKDSTRPKTLSERLWRAALHSYVCLPYLPILVLLCRLVHHHFNCAVAVHGFGDDRRCPPHFDAGGLTGTPTPTPKRKRPPAKVARGAAETFFLWGLGAYTRIESLPRG